MKKKNEHSFSSVISINPYTDEYVSSISNILAKVKKPEYSKDQYAISFLNTKNFIHAQLSISKNIPEEDLYDALYNKAYDELALDQAVEYKIQAIETFKNLDDEDRNFHLFIVDPYEVDSVFEKSIEKIKYIDVVIPIPLLIQSLYLKEIVESSRADCFIYIQENDAFLTIYHEQEFLYTKSLNISFVELHERFCEIYGERIEYEDFKNFLSSENLKFSTSPYLESIIKLYKEIFAKINDVLTYVKRAYELDTIDNIYIGSSIYMESKIDEILEAELGIRTQLFEFDMGYESSEIYIDQIHALMHLYTTINDETKYIANFTQFPRPPKFLHRESGKIITFTLISIIIAFIYPVTYWTLAYMQSLEIDILNKEYRELHNIKVTREATIKNRLADKEKVSKLLKMEKDEFNAKKETLLKIKDVKTNYIVKSKLLTMFTKDLNRFGVKVTSIKYEENNNSKIFKFDLVASNSSKITKLLKYVTSKYQDRFRMDLEKIVLDKDKKVYMSELKVTKL